MIIAKLKSAGKKKKDIIFIGLSDGNLKKLKNGDTILIESTDLDIEYEIIITHGKTEQDIQKQFNLPQIN